MAGVRKKSKSVDLRDWQESRLAALHRMPGAKNFPAPLVTSGFRSTDQNVKEMLANIRAAPTLKAALDLGYAPAYRERIEAYFADPTNENLARIGELRRQREGSGKANPGHSDLDSLDLGVREFQSRQDAIRYVDFLRQNGHAAKLEHWPAGGARGGRAHIHVSGFAKHKPVDTALSSSTPAASPPLLSAGM